MSRLVSVLVLVLMATVPHIAAAQDPHAGHQPPAAQKPTPPKPAEDDHSGHAAPGGEQPREPIPPITDADRAAALVRT